MRGHPQLPIELDLQLLIYKHCQIPPARSGRVKQRATENDCLVTWQEQHLPLYSRRPLGTACRLSSRCCIGMIVTTAFWRGILNSGGLLQSDTSSRLAATL